MASLEHSTKAQCSLTRFNIQVLGSGWRPSIARGPRGPELPLGFSGACTFGPSLFSPVDGQDTLYHTLLPS